ncbi:unnamed protein product [Lasius platythorax]|uniref:Uncharacterized protein n=1 Tax=Lasius platythorax TaxID=488582 RepID=A0AAV2NSW7_9HYME
MRIVCGGVHERQTGKKPRMLLHIRTGRHPKGGEVTIEEIRRTNECLWHGEGQAISPSSSGRQAGRQAGRQPRHKAARTKELRRCTIRARDGRMRIEEDRGVGFKDSRHFTLRCWRDSRESIQGYEGRKEGRKVLCRGLAWGARVATRERERWRFLFKRHQRACRKFSPAPAPPAPLVLHGIIRDRVQSTRIHAFQAGVPEFRAVV